MFYGFFFTNENPRKFVEKQKMIFFYIFMFIWTTLRGRLPKERLPQKTFCPGGIFGQENFPPGGFCPRKTLFAKETFLSKKMSTSLEPLFRDICVIKDTLWQSMWSGAECWQNRNQTLGDCSKRNSDLQTKEQLWNFLLLRTCFISVKHYSHMSNREQKAYYVALFCFNDQSEDYKVILFLLLSIT